LASSTTSTMAMQIQTCLYLTIMFKCHMHPPRDAHASTIPSQHTPMQSMGSIQMLPPSNLNTPLFWIIIPKAEHTTHTNKHLGYKLTHLSILPILYSITY
jgi:hypothetical protein